MFLAFFYQNYQDIDIKLIFESQTELYYVPHTQSLTCALFIDLLIFWQEH